MRNNDKPQHLSPRNVRTSRGWAYDAWLRQQTPQRQRELVAAEAAYLRAVNSPTGGRAASAVAYSESLRGPTFQFPSSQLLDAPPAV